MENGIKGKKIVNHGFKPHARSGRLLSVAAAAIFFFMELPALDRGDLLFYASFDGSLKADYSRGSPEPIRSPKLPFAEGVKGQGVVALQGIAWDGKGNVIGAEGTFSFWLSPVDWSSGDGKSHNFAFLDTANGSARIYQYYPGNLGMLMQSGEGTRTCWTWAGVKKGKFTQIIFTWRPGEWTLYLDGLRVQKVSDTFVPFGEIKSFRLGDGNTIFDELIILSRAITDEEAKAMYYRIKLQ